MIPGAIGGDGSLAATASGPIDFAKLDRAGAPLRIRVKSTVIDVRHDGNPASAGHVVTSYLRDGKIRRVRARSVVMASGGWAGRAAAPPPPHEVLRGAHGRIVFAHSELQGTMNMAFGMMEAHRAVGQAMAMF